MPKNGALAAAYNWPHMQLNAASITAVQPLPALTAVQPLPDSISVCISLTISDSSYACQLWRFLFSGLELCRIYTSPFKVKGRSLEFSRVMELGFEPR